MTSSFLKITECGFNLKNFCYFQICLHIRFLFFVLSIFSALFLFQMPVCAEYDHSTWGELLKKYTHDGLIDYLNFSKDKDRLNQYIEKAGQISQEETNDFNREEWIAFLINVYNAGVVSAVLDVYPAKSSDQLMQAINSKVIQIGTEKFTLPEIRDQILRRNFRDERSVIALVSGRRDSPEIMPEAYQASFLDKQLNQAVSEFINDPTKNRVVPGKKKIYLSHLFREFGPDFIFNFGSTQTDSKFSAEQNAVISFLIHHLKDPKKRLFLDSGRYKVEYLPEDRRLNGVNVDANSSIDRK